MSITYTIKRVSWPELCFTRWVFCPPATIQIVVHLTNMKNGVFIHVKRSLNYNDLSYYFVNLR